MNRSSSPNRAIGAYSNVQIRLRACIQKLAVVHSYRETPNRLKYMAEIRDALGLDRDDLPDYSTIYKSFDRLKCGCGGGCCAL